MRAPPHPTIASSSCSPRILGSPASWSRPARTTRWAMPPSPSRTAPRRAPTPPAGFSSRGCLLAATSQSPRRSAATARPPRSVLVGLGQTVDELVIEVHPVAVVAGRLVIDQRGATCPPEQGEGVALDRYGSSAHYRTRTDVDGEILLGGACSPAPTPSPSPVTTTCRVSPTPIKLVVHDSDVDALVWTVTTGARGSQAAGVVSTGRAPIAGAAINLVPVNGVGFANASSAGDGSFTAEGLAPGTTEVTAHAVGFTQLAPKPTVVTGARHHRLHQHHARARRRDHRGHHRRDRQAHARPRRRRWPLHRQPVDQSERPLHNRRARRRDLRGSGANLGWEIPASRVRVATHRHRRGHHRRHHCASTSSRPLPRAPSRASSSTTSVRCSAMSTSPPRSRTTPRPGGVWYRAAWRLARPHPHRPRRQLSPHPAPARSLRRPRLPRGRCRDRDSPRRDRRSPAPRPAAHRGPRRHRRLRDRRLGRRRHDLSPRTALIRSGATSACSTPAAGSPCETSPPAPTGSPSMATRARPPPSASSMAAIRDDLRLVAQPRFTLRGRLVSSVGHPAARLERGGPAYLERRHHRVRWHHHHHRLRGCRHRPRRPLPAP